MIRIEIYSYDVEYVVKIYETDMTLEQWKNEVNNTILAQHTASISFIDNLSGKYVTITPKMVGVIEVEELRKEV